MKRIMLYVVFVLSCSSVGAENIEKLRIHGSNTVGASLGPELVRSWLQANQYVIESDTVTAKEERLIIGRHAEKGRLLVEIHAHGSSTAFQDFSAGSTDVGMASRKIKAKEVTGLLTLGQMDSVHSEYVIALDGLSVIVHPSNPINHLSKEVLKKIFSGDISDWSELGLKSGQIHVYARDDNSGTYDTFKSLVLDKNHPLVKSAKRYESNAILSDDVASDPRGIGFVGLAYVRKSKVLAIADEDAKPVLPKPFFVATEDYPLSRRLFLYVPGNDPNPLAKQFAEYAVSKQAQNIADTVGFVSQTIHYMKPVVAEDAPQEYRELTKNALRLSLNLRFHKGEVKLDNKAIRDIERLTEYMRRPENRGKQLMLFGFADKYETVPYASLSLSINRADAVADYALRRGLLAQKTRGYGQYAPVANNSTEQGRMNNRRVEVWLK